MELGSELFRQFLFVSVITLIKVHNVFIPI